MLPVSLPIHLSVSRQLLQTKCATDLQFRASTLSDHRLVVVMTWMVTKRDRQAYCRAVAFGGAGNRFWVHPRIQKYFGKGCWCRTVNIVGVFATAVSQFSRTWCRHTAGIPELGEKQLNHLCCVLWLIEQWILTLKSNTVLPIFLWHIREKEFKNTGDRSTKSNSVSLAAARENRRFLLSLFIKLQSGIFEHSVNMNISSFLPVVYE